VRTMGIYFPDANFWELPALQRSFRGSALSNAFGYDAIVPPSRRSVRQSCGRIVDIHVHFDEKKPNYIDDFLNCQIV